MPLYYDNMALSNKEIRLFAATITAAGMIIGLLFYNSPMAGFLTVMALISLFPRYRKSIIEKRKSELLIQFRDMLYSVSAAVSTGRNMEQALEESISFWEGTYNENDYIMQELKYMTGRIKNGNEKDVEVLADFAARSGLEDIGDFVSVYESCRSTGGNLVNAINRATTIIGDKITLEKELKTLMAQKVFESRIVAGAPFILTLMLRVVSPEYLEPMFETYQGKIIITFALVLMAGALMMMERINDIEI